MPSEVRLKKYRNIKEGPKNLNFGASKPGVRGGPGSGAPLDPHLYVLGLCNILNGNSHVKG